MDNDNPITDRIELIAAHLRLIADLMLAGKDLKDVDLAAFALVMENLAAQLERATREKASAHLGETGMDRERQP
jgi:hypothetical protein